MKLFPRSWFTDIDYPQTETLDDWEENKHPRVKGGKGGGQFTSGSGGGSLPTPTSGHIAKAGATQKINQAVLHHMSSGGDPGKTAEQIKQYSEGYSHSGYAAHANALLKHLEEHHGLAKGSLGKAKPKGQAAEAKAEVAETKAEVAETKAKAVEAQVESPDTAYVLGQIKEVAHHTQMEPEEKAKWIEALAADLPDGNEKTNAEGLVDYFKAMSKSSGPIDVTPPAKLPAPDPTSKAQMEMHGTANADQPAATKVALIQQQLSSKTHYSAATMAYGNELIKALGGTPVSAPAAPAPAPAAPEPAAPKPKAAGKIANVHGLANGTKDYPVSNVILAQKTTRTDYANKLESLAKRPASSGSAEAKAIMPSLQDSFWKDGSVTPQVQKAVQRYGGSGYHDINGALRKLHTYAPHQKDIDAIDTQFNREETRTTDHVIVRRGENVDADQIAKIRAELAKGPPPCLYSHEGYTSASVANAPAFISKKVWFHFTVEKGARVLGAAGLLGHHENEVLFQHGQQSEIYAIWDAGGKTHIKAVIRS